MTKLVIFDIDGTLAHMGDRRGPFEWDKVHLDEPDQHVIGLAKMHYNVGHRIIIVSGRDAVCQPATLQWLIGHGVRFDSMFMRPKGDFRPDTIVKREIWDNQISKMNYVTIDNTLVYDDRDVVVKMWREMGLKVFQVASGNF